MRNIGLPLLALLACAPLAGAPLPKDDGYRGIWYANQPTLDEYKFKYSGGLATYPQQHAPMAIYCPAVDKTFFCYGGSSHETNRLLHMVSYFDHKTGQVPRPTILLDKQTDDAHDNPVLSVDDAGFIWIFSPSHGTGRPSFIHRSTQPYSVDDFTRVAKTNFSYAQIWHLPDEGFVFLHTRYNAWLPGSKAVRNLFSWASRDGLHWEAPRPLAAIELGDYQISWPGGKRVATAFDFHPAPLGLNARANLYYLETSDGGHTWQTAAGLAVTTPVTTVANPALVFDSRSAGQLVFLKDLNFDAEGRPVILFLTSQGYEPGPANGQRQWQTLRWTGMEWVRRPVTTSDNNYDHGSLYIEPDGAWRIVAPTAPGPQPYNPGGEMVMWLSHDKGGTWQKLKQLTDRSTCNHTYARRPLNARPGFYAFWSDGDTRQPSPSRLYFTDRDGNHVWRLPEKMDRDFAQPAIAW